MTAPLYNAISRVHDDATAHNVFIGSLDIRLMAAARSRLDSRGHAHFDPAELIAILTTLKVDTGELISPARSTVNRAIDRLRTWGLLGDESTSRCLRVPDDHAWLRLKHVPDNYRRCPLDGLSVASIREAARQEEREITRAEARRVLAARGQYGRRDVE